jgi:4-hydroxy-4-methyl-2-oxoglutarate aldolase
MIKDPPLLTIKRAWPRPDPARVAALASAQTGHIVDALQGRGALSAGIKPLAPDRATFVGPAITCETFADDNLAIMAAIALAQPGDVLVIQADSFQRTAVVGDNVAMMAKNAGIVAIVLDGMARDLDGILAAGLPLHCLGITPNSCVRNGPGRVGLPVVCGGVAIASGDVVFGDRDGVVAFPQAKLSDIVNALDDIRRLEAELQARIKAGLTQFDATATLLASDRVTWID